MKPKTLYDVVSWMEEAHTMSCAYVQDRMQNYGEFIDWAKCDCKQQKMIDIVNLQIIQNESGQDE